MELIHTLGLNSTIIPQIIIFLIAYLFLSQLVFKPYLASFDERKKATVGNQESAQQLVLEAKDIQFRFEARAKEINSQVRQSYEVARKEATKLYDEAIAGARAEADVDIKSVREDIKKAVHATREDLKQQIPAISQSIAACLLGKEVH